MEIKWYKTHFTVSACDISSVDVEQVVVTLGVDGSVEWRFRFESSLSLKTGRAHSFKD